MSKYELDAFQKTSLQLNFLSKSNAESSYTRQTSPSKDYEVLVETQEFKHLKRPITLQYTDHKDYIEIECVYLGIYETGNNKNEALNNFWNFFNSDSKNYLNTPDEELTRDGFELKKKYKLTVPDETN